MLAAFLSGLWLTAGVVHAQADARVTTLVGETSTGALTQWLPEIVVRSEERLTTISWPQLFELERSASEAAPEADEARYRFELADGTRFHGRIVSSPGEALAVATGFGVQAPLRLTHITRIVRPDALSAQQRLRELEDESGEGYDLLILEGRGREMTLRGGLRSMNREQVVFAWNERAVPVPWSRLAALRLTTLAAEGGAYAFTLTNNDVFVGEPVRVADDRLVIRSTTLRQVALPLDAIKRVESRGAQLVYLSDLPPGVYEVQTLVGAAWDYGVDRGLLSEALVLAGRTYERGLSMPSQSRLTFPLGGRYVQFAADVGILDEAAAQGTATVRVLVDGVVVWERDHLRTGASPIQVQVSVERADRLTLEVDYGANLDIGDHVGWGSARLVRR